MDNKNDETKEAIIKRLKRIEGQVRGIQKMIDEEKYCIDILTQISAVRAAINKVGSLVLEEYSMVCIENATSAEDKKEALDELMKTVKSFVKFID